MASLSASDLAALKRGIAHVKANPQVLHDTDFAFLKEYLTEIGGRIPPKKVEPKPASPEPAAHGHAHGPGSDHGHSHGPGGHSHSHGGSSTESKKDRDATMEEEEDDDEDKPFVWKDTEPEEAEAEEQKAPEITMERDVVDEKMHSTPDIDKEVSVEAEEESDNLKHQAQELVSEGKIEEAIPNFIKAAELNPTAINFAARADAFLKLRKPLAAIKDATIALTINPESTKAKKVRGKAYAALGEYKNAFPDLRDADRDFDPDTREVFKKVEKWIHEADTRARAKQRKADEKRQRELRARREWEKKRDERQAKRERMGGMPGGGMGGMPGGMPGGFDPSQFANMFGGDQAKMAEFLAKMQAGGMGGMGGMPGGMPGGRGAGAPPGGMPGGMPGGRGAGAMPGGMPGAPPAGGPGMAIPPGVFNDPDFKEAMSNPSVAKAVKEFQRTGDINSLLAEPAAFQLFNKMKSKFGM